MTERNGLLLVAVHWHEALVATLTTVFPAEAGFADDTGTDDHNQWLSDRRAEAVVAFLASRILDGERLIPYGYSERHPIAPNGTEEGRSKNRRVELLSLGYAQGKER